MTFNHPAVTRNHSGRAPGPVNVSLCQTFCRMLAEDPALAVGLGPGDRARTRLGLGRFCTPAEAVAGGVSRLHELDHELFLKYADDLYDVDNIQVVSARFHGQVGI